MTVNILGTEYKIIIKNYDEDEAFKRRSIDGYCDSYTKTIVVCDLHTCELWEHEKEETIAVAHKQIMRHEITHAFFSESGLADSSATFEGGWATNEEMVDWIALQSPKLLKAFEEAGCL